MEDRTALLNDFLREMDEAELYYLSSLLAFEKAESLNDGGRFDIAIDLIEKSLAKTPQNSPQRPERSYILGTIKLQRDADAQDFQQAVSALQEAIRDTPVSNPDRQRYLDVLGSALTGKFDQTSDFTYLDTLVDSTSKDDSDRCAWLNNFSNALGRQYQQEGRWCYLDASIRIAQYAVNTNAQDSDRIAALNTLSTQLNKRYRVTSIHDDLIEAIRLVQIAAGLATEPGKYRAASLSNLAIYLRLEHSFTGTIQFLHEAVEAAEKSVVAAGDDPSSIHCLVALSSALEKRYDEIGDIGDLNEALRLSRVALQRASSNQSKYPSLLNNIGGQLEVMYMRSGNVSLLDESIQFTQQACDSAPEGDIDRAMLLDNLATRIGRKFHRTGESELLEESIRASKSAVQGTEPKNIYRAERLNNLGYKLLLRHVRTPNIKDLDKAIKVTKEALKLVSNKQPSYALLRNNLANFLQYKFRYSNDPTFLDEGIDIVTELVEEMRKLPRNHPGVASKRHNLAVKLSQRYNVNGNSDDINMAVDILELTIKDMAHEDQYLPNCLNSLGHAYQTQSRTCQDQHDIIDKALNCFLKASELPQAIPVMRINAVRQAIAILHQKMEWDQADQLASKALALLPLVCGRYLSREDQVHATLQASGLAADAGSLALKLGDVDRALEQLEFGRGIILGYMLDSRSDLNDLKQDYPDLAKSYKEERFKANREVDSGGPANKERLLRERREAAQNLEVIAKKIQEDPKYRRFLAGPTIGELKNFATESPVIVVNVTDISSDAIILTKTHTKAVPLPELHTTDAPKSFQRSFTQYSSSRICSEDRDIPGEDEPESEEVELPEKLSWLWSKCVKHILEALSHIGISINSEDPPRVWWVGSGIATSFPFHAARCRSCDPKQDALKLVVSSYSPTIRTLLYSQSRASISTTSEKESSSILVVTMPKTPGQRPLVGAARERRAIEKICKGIYSIDGLESPTADKVLEAISKSDILHFACHGTSDRANPLNSHLLLEMKVGEKTVVDRLSVSKLSRTATTGKARIVYLSACSTAEVKENKLRDEGLHVTSAFQIVGFSHAIGSLWAADDNICVEVAEAFYSHLTQNGSTTTFSNNQVAKALRSAVLSIQLKNPEDPSIWAQFVHFGI